ncbi:amino acid adenylation domain-containing protein, partial [Nocardia sp. NPDC023852]|uniref:amino acid adenylation domain-containing protein n=1 Tax=Nocardia sp. NPDC023852 TaxID=3154697 RepID=UPI0033F4FA7A
ATPVQEIVAETFAEVLGVERVGLDDDFFELGGNSLIATQVAARLGEALDTQVPVRALFEAATVVALAAKVESAVGQGGRAPLVPQERPELVPLSFAQQRMWFLNRFDNRTAVNNIPVAIRLTGDLDVAALSAAIGDVLARHEALRSVYPEVEGTGYQRVLPAAAAVELVTEPVAADALLARIVELASVHFDVTGEIPFRANLLAVSQTDHVVVLVMHHISADGFSLRPLLRDVVLAYTERTRGEVPSWTPLEVQYADYALWQRDVLGAEDDAESVAAQQIGYWTEQLRDLPDQIELPADRPRPMVASNAGGTHNFSVDAALHGALAELARARGVTLFMVVHAALAAWAGRLSNSTDIAIGTPIAGRGERALDDVVGMFVNTLVLRSEVDPAAPFGALLDQVRRTDLAAFANADVPFERLVDVISPTRSQAHHPLFQVALTFEATSASDIGTVAMPGLDLEVVEFDSGTAKFDVQLTVGETTDGGLSLSWNYATELFDAETVACFADRFVRILRGVADDPEIAIGDIDLLGETERLDVSQRWVSSGAVEVDTGMFADRDTTLVALFDAAAVSYPDRIAARFGVEELTYAELDQRANVLARRLIKDGAGPESLVAVILPRSLDLVVALLAVVKTGAGYVPVDPTYPADRIAYVLADSQPTSVILDSTVQVTVTVPAHLPTVVLDGFAVETGNVEDAEDAPITDADRRAALMPDHVAYVIYTSGSTGRPKGVAVAHRNVVRLFANTDRDFGFGPDDVWTLFHSYAFDFSVWELWGPLLFGGTLVVVDYYTSRSPENFLELLRVEQVTVLNQTPSAFYQLAEADRNAAPDAAPLALRYVVFGGEALELRRLSDWVARHGAGSVGRSARSAAEAPVLVNMYGITETTVHVSYRALDAATIAAASGSVVGRAIAGLRVYVLDSRLRPVPVGVAGEIYVAGPQLARGYLGRPDLSATRFVADPLTAVAGSRLYRSGDLARWNRFGELEYLGRADDQVKVRGFRIELGEIESAILAQPGVAQAAVIVREDQPGVQRIVAYVVAEPGVEPVLDEVRDGAAEELPSYMVPSAMVRLEWIPLTVNGKLDRRALPAPAAQTRSFRAPVNPVQETVAEVFAEVLGLERVGLDDSFFALGGDSIVSIQLVSRAKARGVVFTPRDVFEQRTVAGLAAVAETAEAAETSAATLAELPGGGVGTMPLTPVVRFMAERRGAFRRYNQTFALELPAGIDRAGIAATVGAVIDRHDMLRASLYRDGGDWVVETAAPGTVEVDTLIDRTEFDAGIADTELVEIASAALDASLDRLDPAAGVVIRFVWLDPSSADRAGRLIVVAHHLVVDGVSWRILVPDFVTAWGQRTAGQAPELVAPATSMRAWAHALERAAHSTERVAELDYWRSVVGAADPLLTERPMDPAVDTSGVIEKLRVEVSAEVTKALLTTVPALFHGGVNDGLLTALALATAKWRERRAGTRGDDSLLIRLEGHGREEDVVPGADLSRTVGWFTAIFPVRFDLSGIDIDAALAGGPALGKAVKAVKEQLLAVPDKGLGYGLLRYLNAETAPELPRELPGQVSFNYLGRVSESDVPKSLRGFGWIPALELGELDNGYDADMPAIAPLDVNAIVVGDKLTAHIGYPSTLLTATDVREFGELWTVALEAVATHANSPGAGGHTPSDFALVRSGSGRGITQRDIDGWEERFPALADVWPLSALQAGLLFHARLAASSVDVYTAQTVLTLTGRVDAARLRSAAQALVDRYENLRTAFVTDKDGNPVQIVLDSVRVEWAEHDRIAHGDGDDLIAADRMRRFDLTAPPLIRFTLIQVADSSAKEGARWQFVVSNHHILLDGWSMPLLMRDLLVLYAVHADTSGGLGGVNAAGFGEGSSALPAVRSYRHFLEWTRQQDHSASLAAWANALRGVDEPTLLARPDAVREITSLSGEYFFDLDESATARLTALAGSLGITPNTVLQTAWGILLGRMTSRDDVLFGATVSGRPAQLPGVEAMVGLFINTVPVRVRFDPSESVRELLTRTQGEQADLLDHHYVGLADIQAGAGIGGLFDTLVVFESYPVDAEGLQAQAADIDGMAVVGLDAADATHYPLTLIAQLDSRLRVRAGYLRDLFDEQTVRRIADRLIRVLTAIVTEPDVAVGDIELLDSAERELVVSGWNDTGYEVDPAELLGRSSSSTALTLASMFYAQVERTPEAPAVTFEGTSLAYGEFAGRVNQLARWLIARGVGAESYVALGMRRSIDLVVGMYAVAVAGGAYVPLDPDHPAERTEYILGTADPVCVLTSGSDLESDTAQVRIDLLDLSGLSEATVTDAERRAPLRPSNTAYVIFTSGSTGRPKGVAVSHAAIVNRLVWMQTAYQLSADDVVLQKTPATFDVSVWEFFWPLQIGARLVVAKPDGHRDPAYLAEIISAERVSVTHFVPSMLAVFVSSLAASAEPSAVTEAAASGSVAPTASDAAAARYDALRLVFASGEALPPKPAHRLRELTGAALHNLYGPTEAAVDVTFHEVVDADVETVPIGAPVFNTQVYVLDSRLRPVPVGVAGELYLAGAQLARGYVARPDLTGDRFVANPYGEPGSRMYRTGDLVAWTTGASAESGTAGELVYLGRTDFQVKLRGLRIELGEIESALAGLDEIAQAVVVARSDAHTGDQLVAYVIAAQDAPLDTDLVREDLALQLPAYMVPSLVIVLDEFPLNASGKLDRKALPAPVFEAAVFRAPTTPVEEIVATTFADVLGLERVGLDDDFFALGGNSLSATQVAARLSTALDTDLGVRELFEASTVVALAARAETSAGTGARVALTPQPRPELVPLSLAQQRMWFLNRFDPESAVDNIPAAVRLSGLLDRQALQISVADVLARHESLRTFYPDIDGTAHQQTVPTGKVIPDLTPIEVTEAALPERLSEFVLTAFDVTVEVPFRARLFEISPTEHVLAMVVHHISADGFSMGPLTRDVMTAYGARVEGGEPAWRPLEVQYADFALWQRKVLGAENDPNSVISAQIAFWSDALRGLPEQLDLPADRPRPAVASGRGATHTFEIDAETHGSLTELARTRGVTLFMVAHAALAVLLSRLSGEDDIAIGTPVAGRGERALDDLIGMFVNTLVLRTPIDGAATFTDLLRAVRVSDIAAFGHADLPFERLVEILNPPRSQARHPLFQVMLSFQNTGHNSLELPGLTVSAVDLPTDVAKFDLQLVLSERVGATNGTGAARTGITAELIYATDLFDQDTMATFGRRFDRLLKAVAAEPDRAVGDIALLDERETEQALRGWNDTTQIVDTGATLVSMFAEQAASTPEAAALTFEGTSLAHPSPDHHPSSSRYATLTYSEFAARVRRLARHLIALGVGPETMVALGMRRSIDLVVGIYAVVEAGAAYVPLDPDHPAERVRHVLDTADPVCALTTSRDGFDVDTDTTVIEIDQLDLSAYSDDPVTDVERIMPLRPSNTAYVIFTSGSTGRPKGVAVSHAAIVNRLVWMQTEYGLGPFDVVLQKTPATFDVSVWEFFWPMQVGARLVVAKPDGHRDPAYLAQVIVEEQVTTVHFVPSMLSVFVADDRVRECTSLRNVFASGEALPAVTAQRLLAMTPAWLHNLYGPTEAAVDVTYHEVTETDTVSVPIGSPVFNTQVYVLDARLRPVPVGVAGELYLAGAQLARGYVARADLTADRFVANPFAGIGSGGEGGARMYRTGDLVTWTANGELEYLGRTDFQVKLRGLRIELGDIETALTAHDAVAQAVALVRSNARTGDQLVGYVVPTADATVDVEQLRAYLSAQLPSYMVPAAIVVIDAMPLSPNGKLDRRALPEHTYEARAFRAPSTTIEEIVANTFAEVLGMAAADGERAVGLDDNFFDLGGNSLIATRVVARLGAALDTEIPVRMLFEAPTVAALAARVAPNQGAGRRRELVAGPRPSQIPLSLAQQRMWFLNQFDAASSVNNIPAAISLSGDLDVAALQQAVGDVVARHEILRTVYPEQGRAAYQVILPAERAVPDLTPETVAAEDIRQRIVEVVSAGFDVTAEVPLRAKLFRVTEDAAAGAGTEYVLVFVAHHISADGWSMGPLTRDVMVAYAARSAGVEPGWAPLAVQYADFSLWQRDVLGSEADPESLFSRQADYWRAALAGLPDELNLPADRVRPTTQS